MFLLCSLFVPLCSIEEKNSSNRNSKGGWNTMEHTREHALTRGNTWNTRNTVQTHSHIFTATPANSHQSQWNTARLCHTTNAHPRQPHLPTMRTARTRGRPHHPNKPRRHTQSRKPPRTLSPMPQKENNTRNPHRKGKEEKTSQPATTAPPRTNQLTTRINNSLTSDRFVPQTINTRI